MALHELTQEFLARAISVEVRRVNEVSACLAVGLRLSELQPLVIPIPIRRRKSWYLVTLRRPAARSCQVICISYSRSFHRCIPCNRVSLAFRRVQSAVEAPIFKNR